MIKREDKKRDKKEDGIRRAGNYKGRERENRKKGQRGGKCEDRKI